MESLNICGHNCNGRGPPHPSSEPASEHFETFNKVVSLLQGSGVTFQQSEHAAVRTSQEAADVRGSSIHIGAKALLIRSKKHDEASFVLAVMSASRKFDSKKLRTLLGAKSISFATEQEVKHITGCVPGAVPPFGSVFKLATYMDASLRTVPDVEFNAGHRTRSVHMRQADYEAVERPILCDICCPLDPLA
eukprot:TRINITY_DN24435_c0_g1_i1.p2 TRINITY_DN24435_c0_g1~~TRINITY_DN24435_c0_g1_i1.p2  ORF type:complete len:191 (-),score=21.88 TRINITY_DN24435_c0_g1_i1:220-792(-)